MGEVKGREELRPIILVVVDIEAETLVEVLVRDFNSTLGGSLTRRACPMFRPCKLVDSFHEVANKLGSVIGIPSGRKSKLSEGAPIITPRKIVTGVGLFPWDRDQELGVAANKGPHIIISVAVLRHILAIANHIVPQFVSRQDGM
jgi:hypothetical protein